MPSPADAFDTMMDTGEWARVGAVFGGFLGGTVAQAAGQRIVGPMVPGDFTIPDEAYGLASMVAGAYARAYKGEFMIGGGVYAVNQFAERFALQESARLAVEGGN